MYLICEINVDFGSSAEYLHSIDISNILLDFFNYRQVPGDVGQHARLRLN